MTITVLFHLRDFGAFKTHDARVPETVSYNRFVELMQFALMPMTMFAKVCCRGSRTGISFIDSTQIRVFKNKRIKRNKVFRGFATIGRYTMGRLHDFKLHIAHKSRTYLITEFIKSLKSCKLNICGFFISSPFTTKIFKNVHN